MYLFAGLAAEQEYGRFERSVHSFQRLTAPQVLGRQPARLRVTTAPAGRPFLDLLVGSPLPLGFKEVDMAILNHTALDQVIPRGALLKMAR